LIINHLLVAVVNIFSSHSVVWLCVVGDTTLPPDQSYFLSVDDAKDLRYRDRKVTLPFTSVYCVHLLQQNRAPSGSGASLSFVFPPCPFTSSSFALFLLFPFSFSHSLYLFFSSVHSFPFFYKSSPAAFPGRRS